MSTTTKSALTMTEQEVHAAFTKLIEEMNGAFFERRSAITAMALATLAKEHAFILGPPGTAKSAMVRCWFGAFVGADYFEALLSKSRPAEAILGPYDIPQLRDHGHLHRKISGFLPTAHFAMLDEVGKMSPTLGHDLLSVILERRLHQVNGGRSWVDVPLYTFIGGSNELPTSESEDAAALFDRLLVRAVVDILREAGNFAGMLVGGTPSVATTIDFASLAQVIDDVIPAIPIPADVIEVVVTLRDLLRGHEITPSDRRWRASMRLLQASAWLEGRTEVSTDDLQVLRFALWDDPTQINQVERLTLSLSNPLAEAALTLKEKAEDIDREAREGKGLSAKERATLGVQLNGNLKVLTTEFTQLRNKAVASGASVGKIDEVGDYMAAVKRRVLSDILGIDMDA